MGGLSDAGVRVRSLPIPSGVKDLCEWRAGGPGWSACLRAAVAARLGMPPRRTTGTLSRQQGTPDQGNYGELTAAPERPQAP